jgi:hypothetical protein
MKKLVLCALLVLVACEGDRGPTGPVGPEGPPGEVVNHPPVIMALEIDWENDSYYDIVRIYVDISVIDKDGDELVVTVEATAEYPDGHKRHLKTMICRPSEYTPGLFEGYLSVDFDDMIQFRRIKFYGRASDGEAFSEDNPVRYLNIG